jgi:hypothetical protein
LDGALLDLRAARWVACRNVAFAQCGVGVRERTMVMRIERSISGRGLRRIAAASILSCGFLLAGRASADTIFIEAEGTSNISTVDEAVATYHFSIDAGGTYRIWARVIAPTPNDDSFWVRMEKAGTPGSTLVRWNDIAPGNNWHWVLVIADGSTTPTQFKLAAGEHDLRSPARTPAAPG